VEEDQKQYLNEISFIIYESLQADLSPKKIEKFGFLQSI
jgi:hypothetical protein